MGYTISDVKRNESHSPTNIKVLFTGGHTMNLVRFGNYMLNTDSLPGVHPITKVDYISVCRTVFAMCGKSQIQTMVINLPWDFDSQAVELTQTEALSDHELYLEWRRIIEEANKRRKRKKSTKQEVFFRKALPRIPIFQYESDYSYLPPALRDIVFALERVKISFSRDGWLLVNFWREKNKKLVPKNHVTPNIHSAIRQQGHITTHYAFTSSIEGELDKLLLIHKTMEYANKLLAEYKFSPRRTRSWLLTGLAETIRILERCRDEGKIITREKAKQITTLQDSLGRRNPGAMAAISVLCLRKIAERVVMIYFTQIPYALLRQETLKIADLFMEENLRLARTILKDIVLPGKWVKVISLARLEMNLNRALYHLETILANPLKARARQCHYWINRSKGYLRKHEWDLAKLCLDQALSSIS